MSGLGSPLASPLGGDLHSAWIRPYARQLAALLPPGRLWNLAATSVLSRFLLACAEELARIHVRAVDLLREADPERTLELLPEWEELLDLASDGTEDARRARIVARLVKRQRVRPADFRRALHGILGQEIADVQVIERTRADVEPMGTMWGSGSRLRRTADQEIYRFFVYRNPAAAGTYDLAEAQRLIDERAPAHTKGHAIESIAMVCDDPFSLCDRDILGA